MIYNIREGRVELFCYHFDIGLWVFCSKQDILDYVVRVFWMWSNISAFLPVLILFRLKSFHEYAHVDFNSKPAAITRPMAFPVLDPSFQGKVGRFGNIEAVVKTSMICIGENNYYVTLFLHNLIEGNIQICENLGRYKTSFVAHEIGTPGGNIWK